MLLISNCKCTLTWTGPVQELNQGPLNLNELYHVYGATQQSIWCWFSSWSDHPTINSFIKKNYVLTSVATHDCDLIFYNQNASFFHNIHLSTLLVQRYVLHPVDIKSKKCQNCSSVVLITVISRTRKVIKNLPKHPEILC